MRRRAWGALVYGLMLTLSPLIGSGCTLSDQLAPQLSPDGRLVLTPSLHDGTLVRLTVTDRVTSKLLDDVTTGDTDAMKWVTGWVDNTSYLFWGADTGSRWTRDISGTSALESELPASGCKRLEQLYEIKYDKRHKGCLK